MDVVPSTKGDTCLKDRKTIRRTENETQKAIEKTSAIFAREATSAAGAAGYTRQLSQVDSEATTLEAGNA